MNIMKAKNNIEDKISKRLNHSINAGFTNPPADYFENFMANIPLDKKREGKKISLNLYKNRWMQVSSLAIAAILLLALWVFVFDANVKSDIDINFTVDELVALNDFQNYDEDLIYSELALFSTDDILSTDAEMEALLEMDGITSGEIIELYSSEY